jgi:23S rRNA (cytosine1962-C5)-methyltransferase
VIASPGATPGDVQRLRGLELLRPTGWVDYALLDSGDGAKLERFGPYVLERPEQEAIWRRALPPEDWDRADAVFGRAEGGGEPRWTMRRDMPERWEMAYGDLRFIAELTPFRHTGVFPEQAAHWTWLRRLIQGAGRPVSMLLLFGYTGLAALAAAAAGASITYVDASRPSIAWARENQRVSRLEDRPIRWIVDDALKFVKREARRGVTYDAVIMDPPVFGRGPKGEVWRFYSSFPPLLEACRRVLSPDPLFVLVNAYAVDASAVMLANVLRDALAGYGGDVSAGELVLPQQALAPDGSERLLPAGIYGRWSAAGSPQAAKDLSRVRQRGPTQGRGR